MHTLWKPPFTELRDVLAALYPDPADAVRLVDEVGLPRHCVDLAGTPQSRWHAILTEAVKLGLVEAFAARAATEYGRTGASTASREAAAEPRVARRKVLSLYGGEAATNPRHELLAWLRGPDHNLDARTVADMPPHSGGSVDERVSAAIDWADVAIALLTPDPRSPHGAPNVIDEIGRWRGRRGPRRLCIVRQTGVEPYSNHAGIVYVGFERRASEAFEGIRRFLAGVDGPGISAEETPRRSAVLAPPRELVVDGSGDLVLFDTLAVEPAQVTERADQIIFELPDLDSEHETAVRRILASGPIVTAFGNAALRVDLMHHEFRRKGGRVAVTITARASRKRSPPTEVNLFLEGRRHTSAEIAQKRASRILLNDPPPVAERVPESAFESFLRGAAQGIQVRESPVPELLRSIPQDYPHRWQLVRLRMITALQLSECVEHVDLLRLFVRDGALVHVTFRGMRAAPYANQPGAVIEVDGIPQY
ncbi:MAG: effector-associated domain EAD1-containing protein [Rhodoglobus sp.]|nr:effector-associated domain EAD1-containing protein [Rhodoglobus sp.]